MEEASTLTWRGSCRAARAARNQGGDDRLDRRGEAGFEAAERVAGADRHDGDVGAYSGCALRKSCTVRGTSAPCISDRPVVIRPITSGAFFSQMVAQRLDHIVVGAEHRGGLIHRRGLQRDRLVEMAHEE